MTDPEHKKRAMQERAKATRRKLLTAAGLEFEEHEFGGASVDRILKAAGLTKGAFYHHFKTKADLAEALLDDTFMDLQVLPTQDLKLQEVIDTGMILAYRVAREAAIRAALRLSVTYQAPSTYGTPWPAWVAIDKAQLDDAQERGELLPGVDTGATAFQIAGAWSGLVLTAHAVDQHLEHVEERISVMYRNLLTATAHPRCLPELDFSPDRGRHLFELVGAGIPGD
ncbi:TetR family transcriptional regulator (plasmid) [Streptomyces sp. SDT5-1]|uniref:TetR family transcriptional regulator n=1 Tax=Streptomyces sp. SDT5-1 TaxID=3406418 RepID=UPI003FD2C682